MVERSSPQHAASKRSVALAVTTSTSQQGVAVAVAGQPPAVATDTWQRGQPRTLLRDITALLASADRGLTDIDLLVCDVGPGSFTGLRFGLSTVRAIAWAQGTACVGVGSLQTMAAQAADDGVQGPLLTVLPSRRGVVYARLSGQRRALQAEVALSDIASWLHRADVSAGPLAAIVGPEPTVARVAAAGGEATDGAVLRPIAAPDAGVLLRLGRTLDPGTWSALTPRYLAVSQPERNLMAADPRPQKDPVLTTETQ